MLRSLIVLLFMTVSCIYAYDYHDSVFNDILLNELLDASEITGESVFLPQVIRQRRQAEDDDNNNNKCKPGRNPWRCCYEDFPTHEKNDKIMEYKKECFREIRKKIKSERQEIESDGPNDAGPDDRGYGNSGGGHGHGGRHGGGRGGPDMMSCDGLHHGKNELHCVMTCVGQKLKVVDADGFIIKSAMKKHLEKQFDNISWLSELTDEIVDKCITETNRQTPHKNEYNKYERMMLSCNKQTIKFVHCMYKEINIKCPIDKQNDSRRCQMLREGESNHDSHEGRDGRDGDNGDDRVDARYRNDM